MVVNNVIDDKGKAMVHLLEVCSKKGSGDT